MSCEVSHLSIEAGKVVRKSKNRLLVFVAWRNGWIEYAPTIRAFLKLPFLYLGDERENDLSQHEAETLIHRSKPEPLGQLNKQKLVLYATEPSE